MLNIPKTILTLSLRIVLLVALKIGCISAAAIVPDDLWSPRFRVYTTDDGMHQSYVKAITQDQQGFIWLATPVGINRFDGYEFRNIPFSPIENGLPNIIAFNQYANALLAFSDKGDIYELDERNQKFSFRQSLGTQYLKSIQFNQSGNFIITTKAQKVYFATAARDGSTPHFLLSEFSSNLPPIAATLFLAEETVILVSSDGHWFKCRLHDDNPRCDAINTDTSIIYRDGIKLIKQNDHLIILITRQGDIYQFDVNSKISQLKFRLRNYTERTVNIQDVLLINNQLWIATRGAGLWKLDWSRYTFRQYHAVVGKKGGISSDNLYHLFADQTGNLWVSAPNGLNKSCVINCPFIQVGGDYAYVTPLPFKSVYNLTFDSRNRLWFASHDRGASVLLPEDKAPFKASKNKDVEFIEEKKIRLKHLPNVGFIRNLGEAFSDTMIIDASPKGSAFDIHSLRPVKLGPHIANKIDSAQASYFDKNFVILLDRYGNLTINNKTNNIIEFEQAIAHSSGFAHIKRLNQTRFLIIDHYTHEAKFLDLSDLQAPSLTAVSFKNNRHFAIESLIVINERLLLAGTAGDGLQFLDLSTQKIIPHLANSLLNNPTIYSLVVDAEGALWLSSNKGITNLEHWDSPEKKPNITNYFLSDGLQASEFNSPSGVIDQYGRIYFGGINGTTIVIPELLKQRNDEPKLRIESIVPINRSEIDAPPTIFQNMEFSHAENSLRITIGAINFNAPQQTHFYYRLGKGPHHNWVDIGTQREIYLFDLSWGEHDVEIKACLRSNPCDAKPISIAFIIRPPFWASSIAYTLYALLLILALWLFYRRMQRRVERHKAETEKEKQMVAELQELHRLKDQFLANISHELLTPLNGILGLSDILREDIESMPAKEARSLIQSIHQGGEQLRKLVEDLLDFTRIQHKKLTLNITKFDLKTLVEDVIRLLMPQANQKNISICFEGAHSSYWVEGDEGRIRQVLYNLISNAIKYSEQGEARIRLTRLANNRTQVDVIDQGIGIPEKAIEKIFISFLQLDGSYSRTQTGLGLGLSIAKEIVELHGSEIRVSSKLGKGSTFSFELKSTSE